VKMYLGQNREAASSGMALQASTVQSISPPARMQSILPPVGAPAQPANPGTAAMPQSPAQSLNQITPFDEFFAGNDPFEHMQQMREEMDRMMSGSFNTSGLFGGFDFGAMNGISTGAKVTEDKDCYLVRMKIPGLDKSDIKTEVNDDMLTVSGTQKEDLQNKQGNRVVSSRHNEQSFQTSFSLPRKVKADDVKVEYEKDILTIRIPKA